MQEVHFGYDKMRGELPPESGVPPKLAALDIDGAGLTGVCCIVLALPAALPRHLPAYLMAMSAAGSAWLAGLLAIERMLLSQRRAAAHLVAPSQHKRHPLPGSAHCPVRSWRQGVPLHGAAHLVAVL